MELDQKVNGPETELIFYLLWIEEWPAASASLPETREWGDLHVQGRVRAGVHPAAVLSANQHMPWPGATAVQQKGRYFQISSQPSCRSAGTLYFPSESALAHGNRADLVTKTGTTLTVEWASSLEQSFGTMQSLVSKDHTWKGHRLWVGFSCGWFLSSCHLAELPPPSSKGIFTQQKKKKKAQ